MKSLDFIALPHTFETKKNFLNKGYQADLQFSAPIKEPATFFTAWMVPVVSELMSSPLINIKGDSQTERLFYIDGITQSENPQDDLPGVDFSVEVKTSYGGRHSKGKYLNNASVRTTGGVFPSGTFDAGLLLSTVKNAQSIGHCQLHLEFLTEHFFSKLGLAPVIEESVRVEYNGATQTVSVQSHSDSLKDPSEGPLNNKDWGDKLIQLAKLMQNA